MLFYLIYKSIFFIIQSRPSSLSDLTTCGISIGAHGTAVSSHSPSFAAIGTAVGLAYYLVVVFVDLCGATVVVCVTELVCAGGVWKKKM